MASLQTGMGLVQSQPANRNFGILQGNRLPTNPTFKLTRQAPTGALNHDKKGKPRHETATHLRANRGANSDRQATARGETGKESTQAGTQDPQAKTGANETQLESIGEITT